MSLPASPTITDYQQFVANNSRGIENPPLWDTNDASYPGVPAGSYVYVDATSGNDTTGTGASGAPYLTISKAITVLNAGATNKYIVLRSSGGESHFREQIGNTLTRVLGIVADVGAKCWIKGSDVLTGWTYMAGSGWAWNTAYNPPIVTSVIAASTSTAALAATGNSLPVVTRSSYPSSGSFQVQVDSERMLVTGGQGSGVGTFTVMRGYAGTAAAAHASGAAVKLVTPDADQVFFDGVPLVQVFTPNPAAGSFFVDHVAQQLWVGSDPTSVTVEATMRGYLCGISGTTALGINKTNFILRGIGFAHHGSDFDNDVNGAVRMTATSAGQRLEWCTIAYSSCAGLDISASVGLVIDQVLIINTGALGIHTFLNSSLNCTRLRIERANWEGLYDVAPSPTARIAGIKTVTTTNDVWDQILIRNCHSNGFWKDLGCVNTSVTNITCADNYGYGYTDEVSDTAFLCDALFVRNGNTTLQNKDGFRVSGCSNSESANITSVDNVGAAFGIYEDKRTYDTAPSRSGTGWNNSTGTATYVTQAQAKGDQYNTLLYNVVLANGPSATRALLYSTNGGPAPSSGLLPQDNTLSTDQMFAATPFATVSAANAHHNVWLRTNTGQNCATWATPTTDWNGAGASSTTGIATLATIQARASGPEANSYGIDDNGAALTKYFPNATSGNYSWSGLSTIPADGRSTTGAIPSARVSAVLGTTAGVAVRRGYYSAPWGVPHTTPDNPPTAVYVISPTNSSTVSGTVTIVGTATDDLDNPVALVQYLIDGTVTGTLAPGYGYVAAWDSTTVTNGTHTIGVRATDSGSNVVNSATVSVTVSNAPVDNTPIPSFTIEAWFGGGPWATPSWTDITSSVSHASGITITRGASLETDQVETGTAEFALLDFDRRYDPLNVDSPYFGLLQPRTPVRISATHSSATHTLFTGFIDSWPQSYDTADRFVQINIRAQDALAILAQQSFVPNTAFIIDDPIYGQLDTTNIVWGSDLPRQRSGERIELLLRLAGVPTGWCQCDQGLSWLEPEPDMSALTGSLLDYLRLCTATELGRLYVDVHGVIRYEQRRHDTSDVLQSTPQALFLDTPGYALPYQGLTLDPADLRLLRNSVTRGSRTVTPVTRRDQSSIAANGELADDQSDLLFDSFGDAAGQCEYLLGRYSQPSARITSMVLKPARVPHLLYPAILSWDLWTRVTVGRTPVKVGNAYVQVASLSRITHQFDAADWTTTYELGAPDLASYWTIDNPVKGLTDATNLVAY